MTANQAAFDFLKSRKSVPLTQITGPGPNDEQLAELLEVAARVPDHGRVEPWRFIIYRGEAVFRAGDAIAELAVKRRGELPEAEMERERNRLNRAPIAVGVISCVNAESHIPDWEQFLSAGAVAMILVSAATAAGFAANWITGWFCDDEEGRAIIGLKPHERVAGIIHIGNHDVKIPDRPRPDVPAITSIYQGPAG
ncbi:MAG: nitroreductase [Pseudomonadota bacterium]